METSKNELAAKIMGLRPTDSIPFDQPSELNYKCPVCQYKPIVKGCYDERLQWSEYNGFIWCSVCNKDYPSAFCKQDMEDAIQTYLLTVQQAINRQPERSQENP